MKANSKEIKITSDSLVMDIQKSFNLFYPYLKVEFSTNPQGILSLKNHVVTPETNVGKITKIPASVTIDLNEDRTIYEIEQDFAKQLGLLLQVFRKSGKVWNEISLTDTWTLDSQNKAGEFISTEMAAAW